MRRRDPARTGSRCFHGNRPFGCTTCTALLRATPPHLSVGDRVRIVGDWPNRYEVGTYEGRRNFAQDYALVRLDSRLGTTPNRAEEIVDVPAGALEKMEGNDMNTILYVVIGGRHETGVIGVYDDEAKANEAAAILEGCGGAHVESVELNVPTDFGEDVLAVEAGE